MASQMHAREVDFDHENKGMEGDREHMMDCSSEDIQQEYCGVS